MRNLRLVLPALPPALTVIPHLLPAVCAACRCCAVSASCAPACSAAAAAAVTNAVDCACLAASYRRGSSFLPGTTALTTHIPAGFWWRTSPATFVHRPPPVSFCRSRHHRSTTPTRRFCCVLPFARSATTGSRSACCGFATRSALHCHIVGWFIGFRLFYSAGFLRSPPAHSTQQTLPATAAVLLYARCLIGRHLPGTPCRFTDWVLLGCCCLPHCVSDTACCLVQVFVWFPRFLLPAVLLFCLPAFCLRLVSRLRLVLRYTGRTMPACRFAVLPAILPLWDWFRSTCTAQAFLP